MIRFSCTTCGKGYQARDTQAGKAGACRGCGRRLRVPAARSPAGGGPGPGRALPGVLLGLVLLVLLGAGLAAARRARSAPQAADRGPDPLAAAHVGKAPVAVRGAAGGGAAQKTQHAEAEGHPGEGRAAAPAPPLAGAELSGRGQPAPARQDRLAPPDTTARQMMPARAAMRAMFLAYTTAARAYAQAVVDGDVAGMELAGALYQDALRKIAVPASLEDNLAAARRVADAMVAAAARLRQSLADFEGSLPMLGGARLSNVRVTAVTDGRIEFRYVFAPATGPFQKPSTQLDIWRFLRELGVPDAEVSLLESIRGKGEVPTAGDGFAQPAEGPLFLYNGQVYDSRELTAAGLVGREGRAFTPAEEEARVRNEEAVAAAERRRLEQAARLMTEAAELERKRKEFKARRAQEEREAAEARAEAARRAREARARVEIAAQDSHYTRTHTTYRWRVLYYYCPRCGYRQSGPGFCPR